MGTKLINTNLSDILKALVQQVSLKEISTRDFVSEMESLFAKIESLESSVEQLSAQLEATKKSEYNAIQELNIYKKEYVEPALKIKEIEKKLLDDNKDWNLEKKYLQQENHILKEVLASVTALRNISQYNGQGSSCDETPMRPPIFNLIN